MGNDLFKFQNCDSVTKCQYLTQKLLDQNQAFSALDQLAILTCLRKEIGDQITAQVDVIPSLLQSTPLLSLVTQVLSLDAANMDPIARYLQLEASWILTNLTYGSAEDTEIILTQSPQIFDFLNNVLLSDDHQMIEQVLWIISNASAESVRLRNLVLTRTNVLAAMKRFEEQVKTKGTMRVGLVNNILWCIRSMCKSKDPAGDQMTLQRLTRQEQD